MKSVILCFLCSVAFCSEITLDRVAQSLTPETWVLFDTLQTKGYVAIEEEESSKAPFSLLQAAFERVIVSQLALGELSRSIGVIHTPTPPQPLCAVVDPSDQTLLYDAIPDNDPAGVSLQGRGEILKAYLREGGVLLSTYPKEGVHLLSPAQIGNYFALLVAFPHQLIDLPLNQENLEDRLIGATYLLTDPAGKQWLFSTQEGESRQAIWFGPLHDIRMLGRLCEIAQLIPIGTLMIRE